MSLIEDWNDTHLSPLQPGEGSFGPTSGFSENFSISADRQYRVDSMFGLQAEMDTLFAKNLEKVQAISGETLSIDNASLLPWIREQAKQSPFSSMDPWRPGQDKAQLLQQLKDFNGRLNKMKADGQPVQTLDDMLAQTIEMRRQITGDASQIGGRAGAAGWAGSLLGSMWGSLSFQRDPVLVGSFAVPGFGKALATKLASEFAVNAGAEAIQQFTGIRPTRDLLGEEQTNPWADIALAGAMGVGFRGAIETAPGAFRAAERQLFPNRSRARILRDAMEDGLGENLGMRSPTHEELLRGLDRVEQTPRVRATREVIIAEMEALHERAFGPTRVEAKRSMLEVADAIETAMGRKTGTAVNRFLPEIREAQGRTPDPVVLMAKERTPGLYRQLDEARARLSEADAAIAELDVARSTRRLADTVEALAPDIGARVRGIETELDGVIPKTRRVALERELDQMVETVGLDRILRTESDAQIGPKRQAKDLQRSRNLRRKEYSKLRKQADAAEARVIDELEAKARIAQLMNGGPDADAAMRRMTEAERSRPQLTNGIKERALGQALPDGGRASPDPQTPKPPPAAPAKIDIGDDTLIDPSFKAAIDETGTLRSAKELFEDMAKDDAMLQAMRTCAI